MAIEHISDTARWVAVFRAMETERADALFADPYARRLAGDVGQRIVDEMPAGTRMAWAIVVRTILIDEIVRLAVAGEGVDLVVNLAAGLDTRPWRMDVPSDLRWVDVDLPGILAFKVETLKDETPRCRYEAITLDLADRPKRQALFASLGRESKKTLVITEGLLIYLEPRAVGELADDLRTQPSFCLWAMDIISARLLTMIREGQVKMSEASAMFLFAPEESTGFFGPHGWRERAFHSLGDRGTTVNRTPGGSYALFRFLMRFAPARAREGMRRMSGVALMERTEG